MWKCVCSKYWSCIEQNDDDDEDVVDDVDEMKGI